MKDETYHLTLYIIAIIDFMIAVGIGKYALIFPISVLLMYIFYLSSLPHKKYHTCMLVVIFHARNFKHAIRRLKNAYPIMFTIWILGFHLIYLISPIILIWLVKK